MVDVYEILIDALHNKAHKRIKVLREIFNYTQEYLADSLSISQSYYSKIESRKGLISSNMLISILKVYEISVADFVKFDLTEIIKNKGLNI